MALEFIPTAMEEDPQMWPLVTIAEDDDVLFDGIEEGIKGMLGELFGEGAAELFDSTEVIKGDDGSIMGVSVGTDIGKLFGKRSRNRRSPFRDTRPKLDWKLTANDLSNMYQAATSGQKLVIETVISQLIDSDPMAVMQTCENYNDGSCTDLDFDDYITKPLQKLIDIDSDENAPALNPEIQADLSVFKGLYESHMTSYATH